MKECVQSKYDYSMIIILFPPKICILTISMILIQKKYDTCTIAWTM